MLPKAKFFKEEMQRLLKKNWLYTVIESWPEQLDSYSDLQLPLQQWGASNFFLDHKGQLISKCLFGVIVLTKMATKIL